MRNSVVIFRIENIVTVMVRLFKIPLKKGNNEKLTISATN